MARRKIIEEAKKPDIVVTFVEASLTWIKANPKPFYAGGALLVVLFGLFFGFRIYESRKDERAQYLLSQGLRSYQEFALAGQQDSLTKAESTFRELLRENPKGADNIARLYLGKINRAQNKSEEARAYYAQVAQGSADPLIKKFASTALQELGSSK
jgi:predicted negative regulator of RcsB-dependent stress response